MSERKVYALCDTNCRYETLTKEEILTAITQAVQGGGFTDLDTGFITTIKTINGTGLKFFVGEQHEYDALTAEQKEGLFAIITNDATKENITKLLEEHGAVIAAYENGTKAVPKANNLEMHLHREHTYSYTDEGATCDLGHNVILFAKVVGPDARYPNMHFVLPIGANTGAGYSYTSNIWSDGTYLYRLHYTTGGGGSIKCLYLERAKPWASQHFAGYTLDDTLTMKFYKIADCPN